MTFSLTNLYERTLTAIEVKRGDRTVEFIIGTIISKRNKSELDIVNQFTLLNAYLDYKGDEFKEELFNRLWNAESEIMMSISSPDIYPLPYGIVHPILDMFDIMDVFNYIKNIYRVKAPDILGDEFDELIESDARGSRVQTYLKDDYLELAALTLIIKSTLGPVCHFAYIKNKDISAKNAEYMLLNFYRTHRIYDTPPMVKLLGLCEKLVNLPTVGAEADSIRVLEKNIPKEDIPLYILGIVLIQKVAVAVIIADGDKNIITKIYHYINNRLKPSGDVSNSIRNKLPLTDPESGGREKESIIESYRILSDLAAGNIVELSFATGSVDIIMSQLPEDMRKFIDVKVLLEAIQFTKEFNNGNLHKLQINMLAYIFKHITEPRSVMYVNLDSLINQMAVAFSYLWGLGYKNLAVLFSAQVDNTHREVFTINSTVNRNRIPKETKDKLDALFPYKRVINETTTVNVVEEWINEVANNVFELRWIPTAYDHYVTEVIPDRSLQKLLPSDLKIQLSELIIAHERNIGNHV